MSNRARCHTLLPEISSIFDRFLPFSKLWQNLKKILYGTSSICEKNIRRISSLPQNVHLRWRISTVSTISGQEGRIVKQAHVFIGEQSIDLLPSRASDLALFLSPLLLQLASRTSHPAHPPTQKADAKGCGIAVFMIKDGHDNPGCLLRT